MEDGPGLHFVVVVLVDGTAGRSGGLGEVPEDPDERKGAQRRGHYRRPDKPPTTAEAAASDQSVGPSGAEGMPSCPAPEPGVPDRPSVDRRHGGESLGVLPHGDEV